MTQISIYSKDYIKSTLDLKDKYTQVCAFTKKDKNIDTYILHPK